MGINAALVVNQDLILSRFPSFSARTGCMSDDDDVRWWMANSGQKGYSGYSPDSKDFHLLSSVSAPGWKVDLCELCIEKQRCS